MPPSRRKGVSKAAAAAAARKKFSVGDLVLAKVKGFPAWPATVSEPEDWGYSADWKKVLVYFFGTKQIAFCNPTDVEAFTEEKKESLLIKRHGKGADFLKAVQEIVESYEKSKNQDQVDKVKSEDEPPKNEENSVDPASNFGPKNQTETPTSSLGVRLKTSLPSAGDHNEPILPVEDAATSTPVDTSTATPMDTSCDKGILREEPVDTLPVLSQLPETSVTTALSNGFHDTQPKSFVRQKRAPSGRRSRTSSSRVDSSRFHIMWPSNEAGRSAGNVASNVMQNITFKRKKRTRKSPDASGWHDVVDSTVHALNGSIEDHGSEIVTADSDTLSLNEGSTIESGSKLETPENVAECLEGDMELGEKGDVKTETTIIKKKRNSNRKRVTTDAPELIGLNKEADLEVGAHRIRLNAPNACEKSDRQYCKEDGDEHLPLVKRARVRMSNPLSLEEFDNCTQTEQKISKEVSVNQTGLGTSLGSEDHSPADRTPILVREGPDKSPAVINIPQVTEYNSQFWMKRSHPSGRSLDEAALPLPKRLHSVDGEAALPPSKRLHRALEAMSANAAEDGQVCTDAPSPSKSLFNGSRVSSSRRWPDTRMDSEARTSLGLCNIDSVGTSASQASSTIFEAPILEEIVNPPVDTELCTNPIESSSSPKHTSCSDIGDISGSSFGVQITETVDHVCSPSPLSCDLDRRETTFNSKQVSWHKSLPSEGGEKIRTCEAYNGRADELDKKSDTLEDHVPGAGQSAEGSPQNLVNAVADENNELMGICEVLKEDKGEPSEKDISTSPNSVKLMVTSAQGTEHSLHSASVSDEHLVDKNVSGVPSSSSPTDGVDSSARASSTNTSACHISTSENGSIHQNNGRCSPEVHLHNQRTTFSTDADEEVNFESTVTHKPKSTCKLNNLAEAKVARTSFQAILGTLTRTKESIGRATRIAIDCAKFGIAAEVMEIIARSLETEASLHRRVDLFFLVDSITQCSRGLKGEVGDIYPSAIQAMLPRLLAAAAPPGSTALENRRQCLKVLRLWVERRVLPEPIIRRHIRELDSLMNSSTTGTFSSRRSSRTERAINDPLREMEGMLVDEYGSNSSFQLPGFCMPRMLKDEDEQSDSDGESFEAVTPEHNTGVPEEQEILPVPAVEKHRHILEDVDGELEMEDVAPCEQVETGAISNVTGFNSVQTHQFEQHFPMQFAPPPIDVPHVSPPPLPTSPPPLPPPPPPPSHLFAAGVDSNNYMASHSIADGLQQSMGQQSVAPRNNTAMTGPESNTAPYSSYSVSHPQRPVNGVQQDGANSYSNAYHLRPPHPTLSNQFSYVQGDQVQTRRDGPFPPHPNGFQFMHNTENGNFYNDHERMKPDSHELGESWRFCAPSGSLHSEKANASYGPYPCEPTTRMPNQRWAFPPPGTNFRNSTPIRPIQEGQGYWRPR